MHPANSIGLVLKSARSATRALLLLLCMLCGMQPVAGQGNQPTRTFYHVDNGVTYAVFVYETPGSFTFTPPAGVTSVDYLVVGGGGGGAGQGNDRRHYNGGGGGAGGLLQGTFATTNSLFTIEVGSGGLGAGAPFASGGNGSNSSAFGFTALGGGGGGGGVGLAGGSGGGGGHQSTAGGSGTVGQGFAGGASFGGGTETRTAGGGGGAGQAGAAGVSSVGGKGGNGLDFSSMFSTDVGANGWFAGGGGGSSQNNQPGLGGNGGGGNGATAGPGQIGLPGTGGGGGGAASFDGASNQNAFGGAGGNGVVIVRFAASPGSPDPALSTLSVIPRFGALANNSDEAQVLVTLRDAIGVQLTNTVYDVFLSTSLATLSAIQFTNGAYRSSLKTPTAGRATITAYLGTDANGTRLGTALVDFIDPTKYLGGPGRGDVASAQTSPEALVATGPPVASQAIFTATPSLGLVANNTDEAQVRVILRDANGVQITNIQQDVFLSSTLGTISTVQFATGAYDRYVYVADGTNGTAGQTYMVHVFKQPGSMVFEPLVPLDVDYLIVGGGGGGGGWGGGGGAGGVLSGTASISPGSYPIAIGGGGTRGTSTYTGGGDGGSSTALGVTALGGGGGGWYNTNPGRPGGSGGGGGGGEGNSFANGAAGGAGTAGQGFAGGFGGLRPGELYRGGGGGGGAGAGAANFNGELGGKGGDGIASKITGIERFYGGGGGGHSPGQNTAGFASGGLGGGGRGGRYNAPGEPAADGQANTGGGGGGSWGGVGQETGAGGSGILVLRHLYNPNAFSPTPSAAYNYLLRTPTAGRATITAYLGTDSNGTLIGTALVDFIDLTKYRGGTGRGDVASVQTSPEALVATGPPVASQAIFTATPSLGLVANNTDEAHVRVILRDANGVQITAIPYDVFLTSTLGTPTAIQFTNGAYRSTLKTPTAGRASIRAYLGTSASGDSIGTVLVDFIDPVKYRGGTGRGDVASVQTNPEALVETGPPVAVESILEATPRFGLVANNSDAAQVRVILRDANGVQITSTPNNVFLTTSLGQFSAVSGGDSTYTYVGNGTNGDLGETYVVHLFRTPGNHLFQSSGNLNVDYLVVGGGAGGGNNVSGGGGGGGVLTGITTLTAGVNYPVTVGAGGSGGVGSLSSVIVNRGVQGVTSSFNDMIAGGGGIGGDQGNSGNAAPGGSGGGGGGGTNGSPTQNPGTSGNQGFTNLAANGVQRGFGGGGGGAGSAATGKNGGNGFNSLITGISYLYASGGGGGGYWNQGGGTGGSGAGNGGSIGGSGSTNATNAINFGAGGGGGAGSGDSGGGVNFRSTNGGSGANGIVILRYKQSELNAFTFTTGPAINPQLSNGVYSAFLKTPTAGQATIKAYLGTDASGTLIDTALVDFIDPTKYRGGTGRGDVASVQTNPEALVETGPPVALQSLIEATPRFGLLANNTDEAQVRVILRDANGVQITNTPHNVFLTTDLGQFYGVSGGDSIYTYVGDGTNGESGETYVVHLFRTSGSHVFRGVDNLNIDYLVVSGGGGGGETIGGGGGGGQVTTGSLSFSGGNYTITVGEGGQGGQGAGYPGGISGSPSIVAGSGLSSIIAAGGGAGGGYNLSGTRTGGGNGGGDGAGGGVGVVAGAGLNPGGTTATNTNSGAGGGGANQSGFNATSGSPGRGGDGVFSSISGASTAYAGGGGGGARNPSGGIAGLGGSGGGGAGGTGSQAGTAGSPNTGGGGGGGGYQNSPVVEGSGGNGGSGIVILRYKQINISGLIIGPTISPILSNGTYTTSLRTPTPGKASIKAYLGTSASGDSIGTVLVDFIDPVKYRGGNGRGDSRQAPATLFTLVPDMGLTVNTQAAGASADRTVALPLRGNTNVLIEWGDGNTTSVTNANQTTDVQHIYATDGIYPISITGLLSQFGSGTGSGYAHADKIVAVNCIVSRDLSSLSGAFNGAVNLTEVPTYLMPNITNLSAAFKGATAFNQDLSVWNIGTVTTMSDMFLGVTLSPEVYSSILTGWGAQVVQANVSFHGGNSKYFLGAAMLGRKKLTDPVGSSGYDWTITDGGPILPDQSLWYVPESGLVNEGFTTGLSLKYNNGLEYLYNGAITISLASGSGTLSGGVIATSRGGQFAFRELLLNATGVFTFQAVIAYHHNVPQTYTTTVSSAITIEQSAFFGGQGRGEALAESPMVNLEGKRRLTIQGTFTVANKTFDGTRAATILTNNLSLAGIIAPDAVVGTFTALFNSPAIGTNKLVRTLVSLGGADTAKYFVSYLNAPTTTASILGSHYFGGAGKGDVSSQPSLTDLNGLKFYQWLGGAGGSTTDWFTAANWDRNLLPGADDGILILPRPHLPELLGVAPAQDVVRNQRTILASGSTIRMKVSSAQFAQLFRVNASGTLETETNARVILEPGARYLNLSSSSPMLEVQQRLTGVKGWRLLSSPVRTTYADWADSLETAGYDGAKYPALQPNLMWFAETDTGTTNQSWRLPVAATDTIVSGRGHYTYVFNGADRPDVAQAFNDRLPKTLTANGREPVLGPGATFAFNPSFTPRSLSTTPADTAAGNVFFLDEAVADAGWNLLGNPTASVLDWNAVAGWTKTNLHETVYIWDPNFSSGAGGYRYWNGSVGTIDTSLASGLLAPYQAFWVHASAANPQLSINSAAKSELGQGYIGRTAAAPPHISFTLEGHGMEAQTFVSFGSDAKTGPDAWDAYQLESYNDDWLMLFTRSSVQHRKPLVINHLPDSFKEELAIPLLLSAARKQQPLSGTYKLTWKLSDNWPVHWQVALMDHHRELAIPMWQYNQHVFDYEAPTQVQARISGQEGTDFRQPQGGVIHGTGVLNAQFRQQQEPLRPFTIVIIPETTTPANLAYRPDHPYLFPPTPNPFRSETKLSFYLPEGSEAVLEVLDMYGRRLYRSAAARYTAGMHDVVWETSSLAAATYVVRLITPTYTSTQRAVKIDR